jgi:hypothetical protein
VSGRDDLSYLIPVCCSELWISLWDCWWSSMTQRVRRDLGFAKNLVLATAADAEVHASDARW